MVTILCSAAHMPCIHQSHNQFFGIRVLLSQFFKLLCTYKGQNLRLQPEENSSMNCLLLNILCGTVLACCQARYMAQYWHVFRQGAWHSTGLLLDKVHGTVLDCYQTRYMVQYWLVVRQCMQHSTGLLLNKVHGTVLACC